MNTTTIHVKIDTKTKIEANRVAEEFGFTLTALVNALLRQIARTKQLYLNVEKEEFRYLDKLIENDKKIRES